jgi:hypothetical protein
MYQGGFTLPHIPKRVTLRAQCTSVPRESSSFMLQGIAAGILANVLLEKSRETVAKASCVNTNARGMNQILFVCHIPGSDFQSW